VNANTPSSALSSPWHAGETLIQQRVGVAARMQELGPRVIRTYLLEQHRNFYPQLPFVVLGSVDANGDAWATLRAAAPGFLSSPDPLTLHVALPRDENDPADAGLNHGDAVGLLGIELHTRRRNRLNGVVQRRGANAFDIDVRHAFGNCPQYITVRDVSVAPWVAAPPILATHVNEHTRAMIEAADTFFVASYADVENGRQVDVSHRGGPPGFVRVGNDGVLTIPDYAGNRFFNTLGNLVANPKGGLVFVDFTTGTLLQMTGDAEVVFDSPEIAATPGAERLWRFHPRRLVLRTGALPLRWVTAAPE
jgi:predicted pyridoxine 5'-phosphate oxidase superfamily flavin-nucleotide-binding protein